MKACRLIKLKNQLPATAITLLILVVLSGCKTTEATLTDAKISMPAAWIHDPGQSEAGNLDDWWTQFDDPVLSELIARARLNNLDITAGIERLAQFRAILGQEQARRLPNTTIGAAYSRAEFTENIKDNFQSREALSNWDIFAGAAWEIDFFGRVKEIINAAGKDLLATQEDLHDLHVIISADVAEQYLYYRSIQEQESLATTIIELHREHLDFLHARFDAGRATEIDINDAKELLVLKQATLLELQRERAQTLNRISLLLGELPGTCDSILADSKPMPFPNAKITLGIPAELLRRRPDIRKAEYLIEVEASRLKVAQAEYYPKFQLNGNIGMNSTRLKDLLKENSYQYTFGPAFEWRILSSRRISREVRAQRAKLREQTENYRKTVLQALEEVENNLVGFHKEQERLSLLQEVSETANESVQLRKALYAEGIENFQPVINSVIKLRESQEQLVLSKEITYRTLVQLYKALGGGWKVTTDPASEKSEEE